MRTTIKTADITSIGIRKQAERDGLDYIELIAANGKTGDQKVTLYQFGPVRVMETNGDPIWEESDPIAFQEMLEWAGVEVPDQPTAAKYPKWIIEIPHQQKPSVHLYGDGYESAVIDRAPVLGVDIEDEKGHAVARVTEGKVKVQP